MLFRSRRQPSAVQPPGQRLRWRRLPPGAILSGLQGAAVHQELRIQARGSRDAERRCRRRRLVCLGAQMGPEEGQLQLVEAAAPIEMGPGADAQPGLPAGLPGLPPEIERAAASIRVELSRTREGTCLRFGN